MDKVICPECEGSRLRKESLYFKVNSKSIADLAGMDVSDLADWFKSLPDYLSDKQQKISEEILKEEKRKLVY